MPAYVYSEDSEDSEDSEGGNSSRYRRRPPQNNSDETKTEHIDQQKDEEFPGLLFSGGVITVGGITAYIHGMILESASKEPIEIKYIEKCSYVSYGYYYCYEVPDIY